MLKSKEDILQGAKASSIRLLDWLGSHPDEKFSQGPEGKWNVAQHLDHLTQVNKQLKTGLSIPKFMLKSRFGKPNRSARNYDEIVARYREKLSGLTEDFKNPTPGASASHAEKEERVRDYEKSFRALLKKIGKWKEEDLDKFLLPHPLMGKMLVREMLLWFIYHNDHHFNNLSENY